MITKIFIIPAAGHTDDDGNYSLGHSIGRENELRVVDRYLMTMTEVFGEYGLPFEVLDTRKKPGVKYSDRPSKIPPNSVVLDVAVGWTSANRSSNYSHVTYSDKRSHKLADLVSQSLFEWGKCSSFTHHVKNPSEAKNSLLDGQVGVRIEPFALNGHGVDDYLRRLGNLGIDIASAVIEYAKTINTGFGYKPNICVPPNIVQNR